MDHALPCCAKRIGAKANAGHIPPSSGRGFYPQHNCEGESLLIAAMSLSISVFPMTLFETRISRSSMYSKLSRLIPPCRPPTFIT